jgi:hypothetical protein
MVCALLTYFTKNIKIIVLKGGYHGDNIVVAWCAMIECIRKFSSFILNIKEKGRRVVNDNYVNSCSIEV